MDTRVIPSAGHRINKKNLIILFYSYTANYRQNDKNGFHFDIELKSVFVTSFISVFLLFADSIFCIRVTRFRQSMMRVKLSRVLRTIDNKTRSDILTLRVLFHSESSRNKRNRCHKLGWLHFV